MRIYEKNIAINLVLRNVITDKIEVQAFYGLVLNSLSH